MVFAMSFLHLTWQPYSATSCKHLHRSPSQDARYRAMKDMQKAKTRKGCNDRRCEDNWFALTRWI